MEFETQYPVTEDLQKEAAKQLFFSVFLKKKWIPILVFWILTAMTLVIETELGWTLTGVLLAVSFILTSAWVKGYFRFMKEAKAYLDSIDDPTATLKINEHEMSISNSNSSKRFTWDKVTKIEETRNFIVPVIGKTPMISIPKEQLTSEVTELLRRIQARLNQ